MTNIGKPLAMPGDPRSLTIPEYACGLLLAKSEASETAGVQCVDLDQLRQALWSRGLRRSVGCDRLCLTGTPL